MTRFRFLCLLAAGAFVFAGCDSNDDSGNGGAIDRVTINSVEINDFPERKPNGDAWDGFPSENPDIFFVLYDADTDQEIDSTEDDEASQASLDDLPIIWDGDYRSTDLDRALVIELYDKEPSSDAEFMGATDVFTLDEAFDRPTLILRGDEDIEVLLRLEWD